MTYEDPIADSLKKRKEAGGITSVVENVDSQETQKAKN